ncbi:transmembrane protein 53-like [Glandiceps talaboti]
MFSTMKHTIALRGMFDSFTKQPEKVGHIVRACSIMTPANVTAKKIDDNLLLKKSEGEEAKSGDKEELSKPIVLLFSWMAAKQKHLERFADYYLNRGCDVLTIKTTPMQLLIPRKGTQVIAENVVQFVQQEEYRNRPLFVHAFSVGAYLYSEVLIKMQNMIQQENTIPRIIGQVYDSAVDLDDIPIGLSKALVKNPLLQVSFQKSLELYLRATQKMTRQHYVKASKTFKHSPVPAPALFIYSKADPIGSAEINEKVITFMRNELGYSIDGVCFEDSLHCSHMYKYPKDYLGALNKFLQRFEYFKQDSK